MKSLVKFLVPVALSFFSTITVAQEEMNIQVKGEKSFFFATNNFDNNSLEIFIQDGNGLVLFSEYVVNPQSIQRIYNLSEMSTGKYYLLVRGNKTTKIQPLLLNEDGLVINEKDIDTVKNETAPLVN